MKQCDVESSIASIPLNWIGPVKIKGPILADEIKVPLATFETPLWPSTARGARVTYHSGGIQTVIIDERMSRSILLQAPSALVAAESVKSIQGLREELDKIVQSTSRFAQLVNIHTKIVANLIYIRLEITTGDAGGHNMVTLAADKVLTWLLKKFSDLDYVSISANYCTDKKVSAVNTILGRGKHVVAEVIIPRKLCQRFLKTTPEKMVNLNIKKNLVGSILSGGLHSANAHFANILLALYLATGQDAANIIEGSQGIVHAEILNDDLYFSTTLPNIIVGTVGNGKHLIFARENLTRLGCLDEREPGENARRLAGITAATVLCGELSLLAALTNSGELMKAHTQLERA